jgi:putative RNA 2'-phosphotransferase
MTRDRTAISRRLSYVLRHNPASIGLELDHAGWVDVDKLLGALAKAGTPLAREELEEIVRTSDKQRFAIDRPSNRIRANQGHSLAIDLGLDPTEPPALLFHGTVAANLTSIEPPRLWWRV